MARDRHPWEGSKTPNRLADEIIRRIRELRSTGVSVSETARLCGVTRNTVRKYY